LAFGVLRLAAQAKSSSKWQNLLGEGRDRTVSVCLVTKKQSGTLRLETAPAER
jgi:hypothetical protein